MEAELYARLCDASEPGRDRGRAGTCRRMAAAGLALDHRRRADTRELAVYASGDDAHEQAPERVAGRQRGTGIARVDRLMGKIPRGADGAGARGGRGLFGPRRKPLRLEHDPEKWKPVFPRDKRGTRLRGDHAQTKS